MAEPPDNLTVPRLVRHKETHIQWGALHMSTIPGFIRGGRPAVMASNHEGRTVLVPRGQGSPTHSSSADHLILGLEGEADFEFPLDRPGEHFVLAKYDILFIPANMTFRYTNVGDVDVLWFTTVGRALNGDWPPTATYDDGKTVYTWDRMRKSGMV